MNNFFLSLGANKGQNLEENLKKCIEYITSDKNIKLLKFSSNYSTEPVDMDTKNWFLNKVILIETEYSPEKIFKISQNIEKKMGRNKNGKIKKYSDRIIDIDILICDDQILDTPDLTIPHPKMHQRLFVLLPIKEISPDWIHPLFKKNIEQLIQNMAMEYKILKCEKM